MNRCQPEEWVRRNDPNPGNPPTELPKNCTDFLLVVAAKGAAHGKSDPEPLEVRPFFFVLSVSDVERSAQWYGRVFGFSRTRSIDLESQGIRIRLLKRPGGSLELVEIAKAVDLDAVEPRIRRRQHLHGVFKIGFQVGNLDRAISRLDALGVPLRGKAVTESDGSMRSAQVLDPDGNIIQIFEIL